MAAGYGCVDTHDTFPKLLAWNAATFPDDVAMREKEFGIWNAFTWADYEPASSTSRWACAAWACSAAMPWP